MQRDPPRDDGGEAEQCGEVEHVRADHHAGADVRIVAGERGHRGGDLRRVGSQRGEHPEQRLGEPDPRPDALDRGDEHPARAEAHDDAGQEDRAQQGIRHGDPPPSNRTIEVVPSERGHLKVFVGMAAGVGKTYRMLQEGQAEAEAGRDVVIGYLEPHGREETVAQAEGLDVVPRRRVRYRETELEEMNLAGILARMPELCLIDELAHTNAPGVEHEKRYEDVREVLEAGIDVFSTVNVQHLESLNDQVTQLTGVRVRETIPDAVLSAADEMVLVDITPEALIVRLRAGKVYAPGARAGGAGELLQDREPLGAARDGAAPGGGGGRA